MTSQMETASCLCVCVCVCATHRFVRRVEIQIDDVSDALLQHELLIMRIHEAHELGVLQRFQEKPSDSRLVFFCCDV